MPTNPFRRSPKDPAKHHTLDRRPHPIPGMLYRVLDPNWTKLWGRGLEWKDAKTLKNSVANKRLSSTVMIEAEDVDVPEIMQAAARKATEELVEHVAQGAGPKVPVVRSSNLMVDAQLESIRGHALGVAGVAAREAQSRADAAARKAQRKREYEEATAETERLAKEADELAGGDDVGDAEIHDFLDGTNAMPSDAEIKKAKEAASK